MFEYGALLDPDTLAKSARSLIEFVEKFFTSPYALVALALVIIILIIVIRR